MIKEFVSGIKAYGQAFRILSKYRLWGYALIPMFISFAIAVFIGISAWGFSDDIGNWLIGLYPENWIGQGIIESIATGLSGLLIAALGLLLYKHLVMVFSAPFMSILSEKIEQKITGVKGNTSNVGRMLKDLLRGLRIAFRNIIRELFYTFILLIFSLFLPPLSIVIFLVQAFYAGFGNLDYTLERHYNVPQSVQFIRRHKGMALGNGTVFMLLLLTGIGFVIAPPLATAAATIESMKQLELPESTIETDEFV